MTATQPAFTGLIQAETQATPTETEQKPPGLFGGGFLFPMVMIFAIFYFVLIRPEKKKQKAREALLQSLKKGDKVMTSSGMFGSVAQVKEHEVTLVVADGVRIRFNRAAVQSILEQDEEA